MAKISYLDKGISPMQAVINATPRSDKDNVGVSLIEEKLLGYVNLRLAADDEKAAKATAKVLGKALPAINQTASNDNVTVLGLSPNEWLIITAADEQTNCCQKLEEALAGTHHLVADVTGGTTKLTVSGAKAQAMLEKGTGVDLHDSVFQPGQLYATLIAHAPAIIIKNAEQDFTLIIRRSFSDHLARWAIDAADEYGFELS